jgi:hypothetical protein
VWFAAISGADLGWAAGVLAAAIALASFVGAVSRRGLDEKRNQWRAQDQLQGWVDDRKRWHPGVIDRINGWTDDAGHFHEGLPEGLARLRREFETHVRHHSGGGSP